MSSLDDLIKGLPSGRQRRDLERLQKRAEFNTDPSVQRSAERQIQKIEKQLSSQQRAAEREQAKTERERLNAARAERVQRKADNRNLAKSYSSQALAFFTDPSGNVHPITAPNGRQLNQYDKSGTFWDPATGEAYRRDENGKVELVDPSTDGSIVLKDGSVYSVVPGMPWKWEGYDAKSITPDKTLISEIKAKSAAMNARVSAATGELTAIEKDIASDQKRIKEIDEALFLATPEERAALETEKASISDGLAAKREVQSAAELNAYRAQSEKRTMAEENAAAIDANLAGKRALAVDPVTLTNTGRLPDASAKEGLGSAPVSLRKTTSIDPLEGMMLGFADRYNRQTVQIAGNMVEHANQVAAAMSSPTVSGSWTSPEMLDAAMAPVIAKDFAARAPVPIALPADVQKATGLTHAPETWFTEAAMERQLAAKEAGQMTIQVPEGYTLEGGILRAPKTEPATIFGVAMPWETDAGMGRVGRLYYDDFGVPYLQMDPGQPGISPSQESGNYYRGIPEYAPPPSEWIAAQAAAKEAAASLPNLPGLSQETNDLLRADAMEEASASWASKQWGAVATRDFLDQWQSANDAQRAEMIALVDPKQAMLTPSNRRLDTAYLYEQGYVSKQDARLLANVAYGTEPGMPSMEEAFNTWIYSDPSREAQALRNSVMANIAGENSPSFWQKALEVLPVVGGAAILLGAAKDAEASRSEQAIRAEAKAKFASEYMTSIKGNVDFDRAVYTAQRDAFLANDAPWYEQASAWVASTAQMVAGSSLGILTYQVPALLGGGLTGDQEEVIGIQTAQGLENMGQFLTDRLTLNPTKLWSGKQGGEVTRQIDEIFASIDDGSLTPQQMQGRAAELSTALASYHAGSSEAARAPWENDVLSPQNEMSRALAAYIQTGDPAYEQAFRAMAFSSAYERETMQRASDYGSLYGKITPSSYGSVFLSSYLGAGVAPLTETGIELATTLVSLGASKVITTGTKWATTAEKAGDTLNFAQRAFRGIEKSGQAMENWFEVLGKRSAAPGMVLSSADEVWNAGVKLVKNNSIDSFGEGFEEVVAAMGQGGATMGDAISQGLTGMAGGFAMGGTNMVPSLIINPFREAAQERANNKALKGFVNTHNASYPEDPITVEIAKQAQGYHPSDTVSLLQTTLSGLTEQKAALEKQLTKLTPTVPSGQGGMIINPKIADLTQQWQSVNGQIAATMFDVSGVSQNAIRTVQEINGLPESQRPLADAAVRASVGAPLTPMQGRMLLSAQTSEGNPIAWSTPAGKIILTDAFREQAKQNLPFTTDTYFKRTEAEQIRKAEAAERRTLNAPRSSGALPPPLPQVPPPFPQEASEAGEAHTLSPEGSTPSPATNSGAAPTNPGEETAPQVPTSGVAPSPSNRYAMQVSYLPKGSEHQVTVTQFITAANPMEAGVKRAVLLKAMEQRLGAVQSATDLQPAEDAAPVEGQKKEPEVPENRAFVPDPTTPRWNLVRNLLGTAAAAFGYKIVDTGIPIGLTDRWGNPVNLGTQIYDKLNPGSEIGQWIDKIQNSPFAEEIAGKIAHPGLHRVWFGHDFGTNLGLVVDKFGWPAIPEYIGQLLKDSLTKSGIPFPGVELLVRGGVVSDRVATDWLSTNIGEMFGGGVAFLGTYKLLRAAQSKSLTKPRIVFATIGIGVKLVAGVWTAQPFLILSGLADAAVLVTNLDQVREAFAKGAEVAKTKPAPEAVKEQKAAKGANVEQYNWRVQPPPGPPKEKTPVVAQKETSKPIVPQKPAESENKPATEDSSAVAPTTNEPQISPIYSTWLWAGKSKSGQPMWVLRETPAGEFEIQIGSDSTIAPRAQVIKYAENDPTLRKALLGETIQNAQTPQTPPAKPTSKKKHAPKKKPQSPAKPAEATPRPLSSGTKQASGDGVGAEKAESGNAETLKAPVPESLAGPINGRKLIDALGEIAPWIFSKNSPFKLVPRVFMSPDRMVVSDTRQDGWTAGDVAMVAYEGRILMDQAGLVVELNRLPEADRRAWLESVIDEELEHHAQQRALSYGELSALWDDAPDAAKQRVVETYHAAEVLKAGGNWQAVASVLNPAQVAQEFLRMYRQALKSGATTEQISMRNEVDAYAMVNRSFGEHLAKALGDLARFMREELTSLLTGEARVRFDDAIARIEAKRAEIDALLHENATPPQQPGVPANQTGPDTEANRSTGPPVEDPARQPEGVAATREIPSLGTTGAEVWEAWRSLVGPNVFPGEMVVGFFPGEGTYSWNANGKLDKVRSDAKRGTSFIEKTLTPIEEQAVFDELIKGRLQIERRKITGATGVYSKVAGGSTVKVLHQSTGKSISAGEALRPVSPEAKSAFADIQDADLRMALEAFDEVLPPASVRVSAIPAAAAKVTDPAFISAAAKLSDLLWSRGYDTPAKFAKFLTSRYAGRITPKVLAQVWNLGSHTDPDAAVNWTSVHAEAMAPAKPDPSAMEEDWVSFDPNSGTLGIPRSDMPQIKLTDRDAFTDYLKSQGIEVTDEDLASSEGLKPTQAEYSPTKATRSKELLATPRRVFVSKDGFIIDGHHQYVAAAGGPLKIQRIDLPVKAALRAAAEFPKAEGGTRFKKMKPADALEFEYLSEAQTAQLRDYRAGINGLKERFREVWEPWYSVYVDAAGDFEAKLRAVVEKVGANFGVTFLVRKNPKGIQRIIEKAFYDGGVSSGKSSMAEALADIKDVLGATFIVSTPTEIDTIRREIEAALGVSQSMWNVKDTLESGSPYGYRDQKLRIPLAEGVWAEVILITPQMAEAKNTTGHPWYELGRSLDALKAANGGKLPHGLGSVAQTVKNESKAIYDAAWEVDGPSMRESTPSESANTEDASSKEYNLSTYSPKTIGEESGAPVAKSTNEPSGSPTTTSTSGSRESLTDQKVEPEGMSDAVITTDESIPHGSERQQQTPAPATETKPSGTTALATPASDTSVSDWWDHTLTQVGRARVLNRAKVKVNSRVTWNNLSPENQATITELRSRELAEVQSEETPAAPESADSPPPSETPSEHSPQRRAANAILAQLQAGNKIGWRDLFLLTNQAWDGTMADGTYTVKDAYDALELAINLYIGSEKFPAGSPISGAYYTQGDARSAMEVVEHYAGILEKIPTQTKRTEESDAMQQFSTPPHFAYVANWVADIAPDDVMLEPSAGIGGLAVFAKNAGANVIANELSPRRRAFIEELGFDHVTGENAEQLHAIFDPRIASGALPRPTVVVMNPPFSNAAKSGQKGRTKIGAQHVEEALKVLAPGGRLVAIVGEGMGMNAPTFRAWWKRIAQKYNVRANIFVDGKNYVKYGTTFSNRLLVIDKTGPTTGTIREGAVDDISQLPTLLKDIRNDRTRPTSAQPAGKTASQPGREAGISPDSASSATGPIGSSRGQRGQRGGTESVLGNNSHETAGSPRHSGGGTPGRPAGEPDGSSGGYSASVDASGSESGSSVAASDPALMSPDELAAAVTFVASGKDSYVVLPDGNRWLVPGTRSKANGLEITLPAIYKQAVQNGKPVSAAAVEKYGITLPDGYILDGQTYRVGDSTSTGITVSSNSSEVDARAIENEDDVFAIYRPAKVRIPGAQKHLATLVESAAMASVVPPDPTYTPNLPKEVITEGRISETSLENVVYAGQAHQKILPNGTRRGYLIGDGTGVGKGRQIAGIIMDNIRQGRAKAVWLSEKEGLMDDAKRDVRDVGMDPDIVTLLNKTKKGAKVEKADGIVFATYSTLKVGHQKIISDDVKAWWKQVREGKLRGDRLAQLAEWLGEDFDGAIMLDEAHNAGNAISMPGKRGNKKASATGIAVVDLQKVLTKARIVYVSATAATEVENLSYADRLGIWGEGTPFQNKLKFFDEIRAGGISAMEIVARDLKAQGLYLARSISYKGVEFARLTQDLTPEQTDLYNTIAGAWQIVLADLDESMGATGANNNADARSAAMSAFWGAQQRFFNQLLTAMELPVVLADMETALAAENSLVLQIVNTNEATQNRQIAQKQTEAAGDKDAAALEDLDLSPRDILLQYLDKSFPTLLYEKVVDPDNPEKAIWQVAKDAAGNPIQDPAAVEKKNALMDRVATLDVPGNPLEQIFEKFGEENIAEVTGRTQRVVSVKQEDGTRKTLIQRRSPSHRKVEAGEFQEGKRRILIFSDAGGTGFSFHASNRAKNQQRRIHYLVQAGWRADKALQGFGRTNRTDQASSPFYKLAETNIAGHKRFISTIARRLAQLGALTTGERKGKSGIFTETDNLESEYASDAIKRLIYDLFGGRVEGYTFEEFSKGLGFNKTVRGDDGELTSRSVLVDPNTRQLIESKIPEIPQFLNRVLALPIDEQNLVFNLFMDRLEFRIQAAMSDGTYDPGTQSYQAEQMNKLTDEVVFEKDGVKTRLMDVEEVNPVAFTGFSDLAGFGTSPILRYVRNRKSGRIYALKEGPKETNEVTGGMVNTYRRIGTRTFDKVRAEDITLSGENARYEEISAVQAAEAWDAEIAGAEKYSRKKVTFLVGAMLPIWDRLGLKHPKIFRFTTSAGEPVLGVLIPAKEVPAIRQRMGAKNTLGAREVFDLARDEGGTFEQANGWRFHRVKVSGENRIELIVLSWDQQSLFVNQMGGQMERIEYRPRLFIPSVEVMERVLAQSPLLTLNGQAIASVAPHPAPARVSDLREAEDSAAMADAEKDFDDLPPAAQDRLRRVAAKQFARVERENAEILRAHDEEGKPLPAPNGQPSKLNRRQWIQVRTPLFKRWFGDWEGLANGDKNVNPDSVSKVVDENGEPMVVYHGSNKKFTVFNTINGARASYFTNDKELARNYASGRLKASGLKENKYHSFLSIKNPMMVNADGDMWDNIDIKGIKNNSNAVRDLDKKGVTRITTNRASEIAFATGFDGLVIENVRDGFGYDRAKESNVYSVFRPNQIKSATGNEGMFSQGNVILHSRAAPKGTGLSREAVAAQVAREYGIRESAAFRVVTRESDRWEGRSIFDQQGNLLRIELNADNLHSPEDVRRVLEHELGHAATEAGGLREEIERITDAERKQIAEDMARMGYAAADTKEADARAVDALREAWKGRTWFQRTVAHIYALAKKAGLKLSDEKLRLLAERAAVRAVAAEARKLAARGEQERSIFRQMLVSLPKPDRARVLNIDGGGYLVPPDVHANFQTNSRFALGAYHGTPHEVDKFSTDKIGTGEGAQAYGWGLYFASNKKVAEDYAIRLKATTASPPVRTLFGVELEVGSPEYHAATLLSTTGSTLAGVRKEVSGWIENAKPGEDVDHYKAVMSALDRVKKKSDFKEKDRSNLYTVELDVEEGDLLDWDKPIGEQSEKVRDALGADPSSLAKGVDVYNDLIASFGSAQAASRRLSDEGIPGIRYLDGGSRGTGTGTHNYVIFDEKKIRITHRNGQAVPATDAGEIVRHSLASPPQDLFNDNLALATWFAGRFKNIRGVEFDDILQEARIALWRAAEHFEAGRGIPFGGYASTIIRNRLLALYNRQAGSLLQNAASLDAPMGVDGSSAIETIATRIESLARPEDVAIIREEVAKLPERPRGIWEAFLAGRTWESIGQEFGGVTKQRAQAIAAATGNTLRAALAKRGITTTDDVFPQRDAFNLDRLPERRAVLEDGSASRPVDDSLQERILNEEITPYLDSLGLPDDKRGEAQNEIAESLENIAETQGTHYAVHEGAGSEGAAVATGDSAVQEVSEEEYSRLVDRGLRGDWKALSRALAARGTASSIYKDLVTGNVPGVWDIVGTKIDTAADFAALLMPLRSPYVESLKVAVLDDNFRVVSQEIVSVGSLNESIAHPRSIFGKLARLREASGKNYTKIIIAHNHPSGDPAPSESDKRLTRQISESAGILGFELVDHLVTNGETFYSFAEQGVLDINPKVGPVVRGTAKGERKAPAWGGMDGVAGKLAPWERIPRSALNTADSLMHIVYLAKELRQGNPGAGHIIVLNTRLRVTGVRRLGSMHAMTKEEIFREIAKAVAEEGGYSFALDVPAAHWSKSFVQFIRDSSSLMGIRVLDIISQPPEGGSLFSTIPAAPSRRSIDFSTADDTLTQPANAKDLPTNLGRRDPSLQEESRQHDGGGEARIGSPARTADDYIAWLGQKATDRAAARILSNPEKAFQAFATETGRVLPEAEFAALKPHQIKGGEEHWVFDRHDGRVVKVLKPGKGYPAGGDPLEYVMRLGRLQAAAPQLDIRIDGVLPAKGATPRIVTSMTKLDGPHPTKAFLDDWLQRHGWDEVGAHAWKHTSGVEMADAAPDNFIQVDEDVVPIDVWVSGDVAQPLFVPIPPAAAKSSLADLELSRIEEEGRRARAYREDHKRASSDNNGLGAQEFWKTYLSGRLDKLEFYAPGAKAAILDDRRQEALVAATINSMMDTMRADIQRAFGYPKFWQKQNHRLQQFLDEILPTAARLEVSHLDDDGAFVFRDFQMRVGVLPFGKARVMGWKPGDKVMEDGQLYTVGELVEDKGFLLLRDMLAEDQQVIYQAFVEKFPESAHYLDRFIMPGMEEARYMGPQGTMTAEFNRHSLRALFNEWPENLRDLFGPMPLPDLPYVEGYTPDVAEQKTLVAMISSLLRRFRSGARKLKAGEARESGNVKNLFDGFSIRAMEAHREKIRVQTRQKLIDAAATPEAKIPLSEQHKYVPLDSTFTKLMEAVKVAKRLDPTAFPAITAALSPAEEALMAKILGDAYRLKGRGLMIHKEVERELMLGTAREVTSNMLTRILAGLLERLNAGLLATPFTAITNWASNELIKAVRVGNRFNYALLSALSGDVRGAKLGAYEFGYLLRGFVTDRFPQWQRERIGKIVPRELFDDQTGLEAMDIDPTKTVWEQVQRLNLGGAFLKAIQYGEIDIRQKQQFAFAAYNAHAAVAWDEAKAAGAIPKGTDKRAWKRDWMQNAPAELHRDVYLTAVLYLMDYQNVPAWLDASQSNNVMSQIMKRALIPFAKWPYAMAKQLKRFSLDSAFDLLMPDRSKEQRIDGAANLLVMAGLTVLGAWLAGSDDDDDKLLGTNIDEEGRLLEAAFRTGNRMNVSRLARIIFAHGLMRGASFTVTDAGGRENDLWWRYRNYPYIKEAILMGMAARGDWAQFGTAFSDISGEYVSLGLLAKVLGISAFDREKTVPFRLAEAAYDVTTAGLVPTPWRQLAVKLTDPVMRKNTPTEAQGYAAGALDAIRVNTPGLSSSVPSTGSRRQVAFAPFSAEDWFKKESAKVRKDPSLSPAEKAATTAALRTQAHKYALPAYDQADLFRDAGLPVELMNMRTTSAVPSARAIQQLRSLGVGPESYTVTKNANGQTRLSYPDPATVRVSKPAYELGRFFGGVNLMPVPRQAITEDEMFGR